MHHKITKTAIAPKNIAEAAKDFASDAYSIYTEYANRLVAEQMGLDTIKEWDEFEAAADSGEYELANKLHDKAVVFSKYYGCTSEHPLLEGVCFFKI